MPLLGVCPISPFSGLGTHSIFVADHRIRFVSCTATLANPGSHMQTIFNLPEHEIEVVDVDGAPSARKDYLVWNPPLIDETQPSLGRRGSIGEATALMRFLMKRGIRVLLFCKVNTPQIFVVSDTLYDLLSQIRKICELVSVYHLAGVQPVLRSNKAMKTMRTDLSNEGRLDILAKVKPYRGGKGSNF